MIFGNPTIYFFKKKKKKKKKGGWGGSPPSVKKISLRYIKGEQLPRLMQE